MFFLVWRLLLAHHRKSGVFVSSVRERDVRVHLFLFNFLMVASLQFTVAEAVTTDRWSWLAGTYWYVPTKNLPAYTYSPITNTLTKVSDQTVFHITDYANGYFSGNVVGQIDSNSPACMSLVGSVTPEGKVYLNFNILPFSPTNTATIGLGTMVRKGGAWTMENQMSSGSSVNQVGHWAYMILTKPGLPSWSSLPGLNISVQQFLGQCPDNAPSSPH
jgi:hypothetical protein